MISKRLEAIVDLIDPNLDLIDIGTDHGIIPVEVLKNHFDKKIIATDINPKPLSRAEGFINKNGFNNKVDLRVGNGFEIVNDNELEQVVIAGMGGELIAQILNTELNKSKKINRLILQPMTHVEVLRKFLVENGFNIVKDIIIEDNQSKQSRFFHILVTDKSNGIDYKPDEILFGPISSINDKSYQHYLKYLINQYSQRLKSMEKSNSENTNKRRLEYERRFQFLNKLYESIKNC